MSDTVRVFFARLVLLLILAAVAPIGSHAAETASLPAKPNIILFLVDDMGWQDTSVPFWTQETPLNKRYHTPNMERLASEGMKFTNAYAAPVCSPSRVSLVTGLNAARHRVTNWTKERDKTTDSPHPRLILPFWNVNGLSPDTATSHAIHAKALPAYLREAGYRTIHIGKAHFGAVGTPGADPRALGFDVNIAGGALGNPASYLGEENYGSGFTHVPGLEKYHGTDTFLTEALTREAIQALDQAQADRKPFFLYMAHYAVHTPYAADSRFIQKYRDAGLDKIKAMYASLVEGMDKSLGDLMAYLDKNHLLENTVVLFMSDNGGLSAHARGGEPETHNLPLSCGKGSAREGGIRVPMIVKWPGTVRSSTVCETPVIIEDFFPSILEIAGADGPKTDGLSFVPQLKGDTSAPERELVWHMPNNWGPGDVGYGPFSAIRKGDWKYIFYHDPAKAVRQELFNLKDDIGETKNLAHANPAKTRELATALRARLESVNAQMPVVKTPVGPKVEIP